MIEFQDNIQAAPGLERFVGTGNVKLAQQLSRYLDFGPSLDQLDAMGVLAAEGFTGRDLKRVEPFDPRVPSALRGFLNRSQRGRALDRATLFEAPGGFLFVESGGLVGAESPRLVRIEDQAVFTEPSPRELSPQDFPGQKVPLPAAAAPGASVASSDAAPEMVGGVSPRGLFLVAAVGVAAFFLLRGAS